MNIKIYLFAFVVIMIFNPKVGFSQEGISEVQTLVGGNLTEISISSPYDITEVVAFNAVLLDSNASEIGRYFAIMVDGALQSKHVDFEIIQGSESVIINMEIPEGNDSFAKGSYIELYLNLAQGRKSNLIKVTL